MLRTLWIYLVGLVLTGYWSLRVLALQAIGSKRLPQVAAIAPRRWAAAILRAGGIRVRYEDEHLLPPDQAQILIANHQSWFDVFALAGTLPVDYRFVGKKELSRIFLFGPAWLAAGHYAIDRSDRQAAIASLQTVGDAMRDHRHTVVMFPEGTRSPDGGLAPFKKGAFVLAIKAGVPVVPVAILGSREIMPKGRWRVRSGEITIRVGEAIPTEGLRLEDRDRLTRLAWQRIAELKGELPSPSERPPGPEGSGPDPEQAGRPAAQMS